MTSSPPSRARRNMINTESFRAWKDTVEYAGLRDGEKQKLQKDIDIVADELDRLYLDHAPLTREELEGVLKEAGFVKDESNGVFTRNHEFYLQKDYEEWFELSIKGG